MAGDKACRFFLSFLLLSLKSENHPWENVTLVQVSVVLYVDADRVERWFGAGIHENKLQHVAMTFGYFPGCPYSCASRSITMTRWLCRLRRERLTAVIHILLGRQIGGVKCVENVRKCTWTAGPKSEKIYPDSEQVF